MLSLMARKENSPEPIKEEDAIADFLIGKNIKTNINFGGSRTITYEEIIEICKNINNNANGKSDIKENEN